MQPLLKCSIKVCKRKIFIFDKRKSYSLRTILFSVLSEVLLRLLFSLLNELGKGALKHLRVF